MSTAADLANYYTDGKLMTGLLFTSAGEPESRGLVSSGIFKLTAGL